VKGGNVAVARKKRRTSKADSVFNRCGNALIRSLDVLYMVSTIAIVTTVRKESGAE